MSWVNVASPIVKRAIYSEDGPRPCCCCCCCAVWRQCSLIASHRDIPALLIMLRHITAFCSNSTRSFCGQCVLRLLNHSFLHCTNLPRDSMLRVRSKLDKKGETRADVLDCQILPPAHLKFVYCPFSSTSWELYWRKTFSGWSFVAVCVYLYEPAVRLDGPEL